MALVLNLLWVLVGMLFGGYILIFGRRALWATLGIIVMATSANLLAVLVAGADAGRDLLASQEWEMVGVAVAVGVLGVILGKYQPDLAGALVGFAAGAGVTLWFYEIVAYLITDVAKLPREAAAVIELALLLLGGSLGLWLVRTARDEALILVTVVMGTELIQDALGLSRTSSLTAILVLSLALFGVLAQYADYLLEQKMDALLSEPQPATSSVAYFQEWDLD